MTEQVRGVRSKRLARPQVGGVLYSAPPTQSISGVLALSASVAKLSAPPPSPTPPQDKAIPLLGVSDHVTAESFIHV